MNFNLSDEQAFVKDTIRRFMTRECPRDVAHQMDQAGKFPGELLRKVAGLGFCSLTVPEEYGGGGPNLLAAALVAEEIAAMLPPLAGAFAGIAFRGGQVIAALGSEAQKQRLLPAIVRGELLFSYALDQPTAAVEASQTTAARQAGAFILNGRKAFVALAGRADYLSVLARTGDGQSLFLVPATAQGIDYQPVATVGYRGSGLSEAVFQDVRLSVDDLLGGPAQLNRGEDQGHVLQTVDHLASAAIGLGIAQGAYDYAAGYASERVQFGQRLAQFEAVQHMLVDLAIDIRAARLLFYQACWQADQGQPFDLTAAMARARTGALARQAGLQSVHILGGYGYMAEYDAQRYMRDSLVLFSGSETTELLKNSVGSLLELG